MKETRQEILTLLKRHRHFTQNIPYYFSTELASHARHGMSDTSIEMSTKSGYETGQHERIGIRDMVGTNLIKSDFFVTCSFPNTWRAGSNSVNNKIHHVMLTLDIWAYGEGD